MWGISIRSRIQLQIFRNAFRGKSAKDRCDNYKDNYGYYVSIKRRIRKILRNFRNWLRNIRNLFLIFENQPNFYFLFSKKNKELDTLPQPKYFTQTSNQLPNSNLKRTTKHHRGIEPRSSCTTHFTLPSRPSLLLVETCLIV